MSDETQKPNPLAPPVLNPPAPTPPAAPSGADSAETAAVSGSFKLPEDAVAVWFSAESVIAYTNVTNGRGKNKTTTRQPSEPITGDEAKAAFDAAVKAAGVAGAKAVTVDIEAEMLYVKVGYRSKALTNELYATFVSAM